MLLLTPILLVPPLVALACLLTPSRWRWLMEGLNILAFGTALALGIQLLPQVLAHHAVTEWNEFLYADALSVWMVLLISVVSLASAIYAVGHLRRDRTTRHNRPASSGAIRMGVRSNMSALQLVQLARVHRGKVLANAIDQYPQHHHGHHQVKEDA